MLSRTLTFSPEHDQNFFQELPATAAVFTLRGDGEPYVSKTANLRRRLHRLLGPPVENSRRLNLRDRVREIEFTPTGSDFESQLLLYRVLRATFPKTYAARLRLRPAPLVKLHLENGYPRASVTTRLGKFPPRDFGVTGVSPVQTGASSKGEGARASTDPHGNLYYGPFPSRAAAENFASEALDFFKMRRCVEDLHPDPSFPGCIYSEMKMCLAPCFKGCTDAEYQAEVSRVKMFFDTRGESLVREFAQQRDRASADLAFEEAAAIHAKGEKLKPLLSQLPEIVHRIDQLKALVIQPGAQLPVAGRAGTEPSTSSTFGPTGTEPEPTRSVGLFLFRNCTLTGPIEFGIQPRAEPQSMESRVAEAIAAFSAPLDHSTVERSEHLSILKRWYYRSNRVGEIFFADASGDWPLRRIVRGIGRVYRGEQPQEPSPFSATQAGDPTSHPA